MKAQFVLLILFGLMISCQARADDVRDTVRVSATGEVTAPSDTVVLHLLVTTSSSDLQETKNRNDQITTQIYKLAESQAIPRAALNSTELQVDFETHARRHHGKGVAQQAFDKGGKQQAFDEDEAPRPPIRMLRHVEVRFDDLSQTIRFMAEVVKWESVRATHELTLAPLRFGVANPHDYLADARRRAVASAKETATLLAKQNGLTLGNATQIYDGNTFGGEASLRPDDDPFAAGPGAGTETLPQPSVGLFSVREDRPQEKLNIDRIPPAQIKITAGVTIVFKVHKP
jgi:uncharacterized protein YggE